MDIASLYNQHLIILACSILSDVVAFAALFVVIFKLIKTKKMVAENNREIFEHDKEIYCLHETIAKLKK